MGSILENIIIDHREYGDLGAWKPPGELSYFSKNKTLYEYQMGAIENISRVLYEYFADEAGNANNTNKNYLFGKYREHGLEYKSFAVNKFETKHNKRQQQINQRFSFFMDYFKSIATSSEEYISGENFINRASFWMATGSGKSLVLIKLIELLGYLQDVKLIPKREIMLLLPREDLIRQFKKEVAEFNWGREQQLELVDLKDYEDDKYKLGFGNIIKVYYYRSDLLRDERKQNIIDYKNYINDGKWYVFLDEAHRGEKKNSKLQDYVSVLSRNGFLFNFSATFTEDIDYVTSCYNFNLKNFISDGYGKNLYLSESYFKFTKDKDDFSERDKQKQILKSLIILSFIKKSRKPNLYHNPLLISLVNSVNTDESDLQILFLKLGEIAADKIDKKLFNQSLQEITDELSANPTYSLTEVKFAVDIKALKKITTQDILRQVFNTAKPGKIELREGEKGKEILLQLETTSKPFALIKIGNADKFQKEKLGNYYNIIAGFDDIKYFANINQDDNINLLLGSRSFYEGWDSNRPNIINMINIGKKDAKKFVLQAIGRGVRIEPYEGKRMRLAPNSNDKNILLETLFIFATDKGSVKAILEIMEKQQDSSEYSLDMFEEIDKPFDILIPLYRNNKRKEEIARFNIAKSSLTNFKNYLKPLALNTLLLKTRTQKKYIVPLLSEIKSDSFFQLQEENTYSDMDLLLQRVIDHRTLDNKEVSKIESIQDEIIHFKQIKAINFNKEELTALKGKITKVKDYQKLDKQAIEKKVKLGKIPLRIATKLLDAKKEEEFLDTNLEIKIKKITEHYYMPLIYSTKHKDKYLRHIIDAPSEINFIKNLEGHITNKPVGFNWMFSKINESLDKIFIPYFHKKDNSYRNFYPDFIFWLPNGNNYKIIFIDPKGTAHTDYQNKVDGFEYLFYSDKKPRKFSHGKFNVTFDLKLVTDDVNKISGKYEKYWLDAKDFSFLEIKKSSF